jgi:hypothetical protein
MILLSKWKLKGLSESHVTCLLDVVQGSRNQIIVIILQHKIHVETISLLTKNLTFGTIIISRTSYNLLINMVEYVPYA